MSSDPPPSSVEQQQDESAAPQTEAPTRRERRSVHYPQQYLWFVFLSAMDLMLTWMFVHLGGDDVEANPLAAWVIEAGGLVGLVLYKFGLLVVVVLICEYVGRQRESTGRKVANVAVVISAFPVAISLGIIVWGLVMRATGS